MSIGTRIKERRLALNMTQEDLAKRLNVSKGAIANYENEVSTPKPDILFDVISALKCDANYLFQDMVDLKDETVLSSEEYRVVTKYRRLDEISKATVDNVISFEYEQSIKRINKQKEKTVYYLPEYDVPVSAGTGMPLDYSNCEISELTEQPPKGASFIVTVSGDSMEPTYTDGDRLYISKDTVIDYGTIGLFMYMGDVYVKEYTPDGLVSHNSKYDIINKNEDIECIGKVLGKVMK